MGEVGAGTAVVQRPWRGRGIGLLLLTLLAVSIPGDPRGLLEAIIERTRSVPAANPLIARAAEARLDDDPSTALSIRNHVLFDGALPVTLAPSPSLSAGNRPRFVILHYTVSGSAAAAVRWMRRPSARVSAHLLIDRSGRVSQLVPFDFQAWHAGPSRLRGERRLNAKSIGIELVNWGPLAQAPDGTWRTGAGHRVSAGQVVGAGEDLALTGDATAGWHRYPAAQIDRLASVLRVLRQAYGIEEIVGHQDVAPGRKVDPGPAFPWRSLKARLSEGRPS